jgi:mannitol-1-phosphate 5-dehydrogenase
MGLTGSRTYVGFGFGAIQSGLFLFEAYQSGAFKRLIVAEVVPEIVSAVRKAGGKFQINIAFDDHVGQASLDGIEIYDPADSVDRQGLMDAIAQAEEISTAIPSVDLYATSQPHSLHRILAAGLSKKIALDGPQAIVYTAENHNHAAEILKTTVLEQVPPDLQAALNGRVCFLNTVIGKMSQVVSDRAEIHQCGLATITPDLPRAFLVESFNKILISKIQLDEPFQRGIARFIEKDNLLPFEEAKLFGHNATHALGGYLGSLMGMRYMADLAAVPGMSGFLRRAFLDESGRTLIHRYQGIDPLFTPGGYQAYADDLLQRMMNPYLLDRIERVTRDPARKLGWDDRLIGTMRAALSEGVQPKRFAFGAAAALSVMSNDPFSRSWLDALWQVDESESDQKEKVFSLLEAGWVKLAAWREASFPNIEAFFENSQRTKIGI